jgi:hypothetical protein
MRIMGFKLEWVVIGVLVLYILYCQREHLTNPATPPKPPQTTSCPSGYAYDAVAKTCNPTNQDQGAGPVPSGSGTTASPAPAISSGPVTNTAPMTTPIPTMPPVHPPSTSPVEPATTTSSIPARH